MLLAFPFLFQPPHPTLYHPTSTTQHTHCAITHSTNKKDDTRRREIKEGKYAISNAATRKKENRSSGVRLRDANFSLGLICKVFSSFVAGFSRKGAQSFSFFSFLLFPFSLACALSLFLSSLPFFNVSASLSFSSPFQISFSSRSLTHSITHSVARTGLTCVCLCISLSFSLSSYFLFSLSFSQAYI